MPSKLDSTQGTSSWKSCVCEDFALLDAQFLDRTATICFLFFDRRIPIIAIARIFNMSSREVEIELTRAFERLQENFPTLSFELHDFSREPVSIWNDDLPF